MVDLNPFASSKAHRRLFQHRHQTASSKKRIINPRTALLQIAALFLLIYFGVLVKLIQHHNNSNNENEKNPSSFKTIGVNNLQKQQQQQRLKELLPNVTLSIGNTNKNNPPSQQYKGWKDLAMNLAGLYPEQILETLINQDPFGVRTFEVKLLEMESTQQSILSLETVKELFGGCPSNPHRITLPDQRNHERARNYRMGIQEIPMQNNQNQKYTNPFVFLFFQHLRKAGGTNFCTLAEHNLLQAQVPSYYCMPDMHWSGNRCAGCFSSFTNQEIEMKMLEAGHRILGNEWDPFDVRFFELPAIFATSFRKPLDRAVSQFRFECIEDRGCKIKNVTEWWDKRKDLNNVYTWTFTKQAIRKISIGRTTGDAKKRQELIGKALDTIIQFNLVMVMEWLAYAPEHVSDVLGYHDTTTMTERVRPHITQFKRDDGQEHNNLGAAGITKASWDPINYLPPNLYKKMSEELALDEILTDAARRIFLERIICNDMKESNWL